MLGRGNTNQETKQTMGWHTNEQFLNQSFRDQLNSIQILEQLVSLELAKQHLLADIINILECLG